MRAPLIALLFAGAAMAQVSQVSWTLTGGAASDGKAIVRAAAAIEPGWHLYSASSPAGIPTTFRVGPASAPGRLRVFQPAPHKAYDKNFEAETETFENSATFFLEVERAKDATSPLDVNVRYQTCNDKQCVPSRWSGAVPLTESPAPTIPAGYSEAKPPAPQSTGA
ncbi:MAG TPA: protein-disulfide reductase DsbD N-terminal domain-containing protein, partial [Gemmatimonadales bacterium]